MQPTITSVDPRQGTVTVQMEDRRGKGIEKTFQLTEDILYLDSTGRVATLDVFLCGDEVLFIEMEGKIKELKRASVPSSRSTGPGASKAAAFLAGEKSPARKEVPEGDIRLRAYRKWESAGKPVCDGTQFWLAAENELRHEKH